MFKWLGSISNARERKPRRLAVLDAVTVDRRRSLVLIRRDNIEHLLMIGGPADVVIEPNIVRTNAREPAWHSGSQPTRPAADSFNRPMPPEVPPPRQRRAPRVSASSSSPNTFHNLEELTRQLEAALHRSPAPPTRPPVTDPFVVSPEEQLDRQTPRLASAATPKLETKGEPSGPHLELPKAEAESKLKLQAEPELEPKLEPLPEPLSEEEPAESKKASDIL